MSSAVMVGDRTTAEDHTEGSGEQDVVILATVTEPGGEGAIEDSYELVDHHSEVHEEEQDVPLEPTVIPSSEDLQSAPAGPDETGKVGIAPLAIPCPSAEDSAPIEPTVTPPMPPPAKEDQPEEHSVQPLPSTPHTTANSVNPTSDRNGLAQCAAPLSSIDPDLLLAMQLQEQEDLLAAQQNPPPDPRYNSFCDAQGFRYQAPQGHNAPAPAPAPAPATGGGQHGAYEGVQGALMSQEERDREYSLMLHYQEVQAAEERRNNQHNTHGALPRGHPNRQQQQQQHQERSRQKSKDKNCVIC